MENCEEGICAEDFKVPLGNIVKENEESTEISAGIQDLQDFLYSAPMEIGLVMLVNSMVQV